MIYSNVIKLIEEIEENNIKKAYLLLVEDQYLLTKLLITLKKRVITEELVDFNFAQCDLKYDKIDDLIYTANCFPIMSLRKLIICQNIDSIKSTDEKKLMEFLKRAPNFASIVFISEKTKSEGKLVKFMEKEFQVVKILHPRTFELDMWIKKIADSFDKKIDSESIDFVKYYIGNDLLKIESEINKVATYISQDSDIIRVEHLKQTVEFQNSENIFELIDYIISGNIERALLLLNETIKRGESAILIFALIGKQIRKYIRGKLLLKMGLSQNDLASKVGVPPFKRKDYLQYLKSANTVKLIGLYRELLKIDKLIKSSSIDMNMLLERLVINLQRGLR